MKKMTNYPIYDRQKTTQAAVSDCLSFYSSPPSRGEVRRGLLFHEYLLATNDVDTLLERVDSLTSEVVYIS